jgi:hypothetical protein
MGEELTMMMGSGGLVVSCVALALLLLVPAPAEME